MSYDKNKDGPEASATLKKIEQAILRVGAIRQRYLDQCQTSGGISPRLRKEFHSAVLNYYIELRPFRNHQNVKDDWQNAEILTDQDGDSVEGLSHLLNWVNRTRASQSTTPGRGNATQGSREPELLPPQQLLKLSMLLDDIAHELGFAPESKTPVADATEAVI